MVNPDYHLIKINKLMLYTKFESHWPAGFWEDFWRVFTIYGHGGHLGHISWIIWINFCSPIPLRLHMKFGFDWPSGFWVEDVQRVWTMDDNGQTMVLAERLRWAKNSDTRKIPVIILKIEQCEFTIEKCVQKMQMESEPRHEKPVFRVSNQVRHRPACSATGASYTLEILDRETRGIILSRKQKQRRWSDCADAQADLCLVVRIWHKQVFSWRGSYGKQFRPWSDCSFTVYSYMSVRKHSIITVKWVNDDNLEILYHISLWKHVGVILMSTHILTDGNYPLTRPSLKIVCLQLPTQVFKEWVGRLGISFFYLVG